jgi:hypothetical protein
MLILYVDTERTKRKYADCLANSHNGTAAGNSIEFNAGSIKEANQNHQDAMDEIIADGIFGFSNHARSVELCPTLTVNDLNWTEQGFERYCKVMAEKECLVILTGNLDEPSPCKQLAMMNAVLMRFIDSVVVTNSKSPAKADGAEDCYCIDCYTNMGELPEEHDGRCESCVEKIIKVNQKGLTLRN